MPVPTPAKADTGSRISGQSVSYLYGALLSVAADVHRYDAAVVIKGVAVADVLGVVAFDVTGLAFRHFCR